jgi:hypothetical protein
MYNCLKNKLIITFAKIFFLFALLSTVSEGCWPGHKSSSGQTPVVFRGTWHGIELWKQDTVFYKITFLPENRFRLVSLSVPLWHIAESSGSLRRSGENLYPASTNDFTLEVLSVSAERLIISFSKMRQRAIDLYPIQTLLLEKAWELSSVIGPAGDTLSLNRKQKIVLRFRADNFVVLSLAGPKPWGYYFLKGDSVFLQPVEKDYLPKLLRQGFYRYQAYEDSTIFTSPQGEKLIFNRRLF